MSETERNKPTLTPKQAKAIEGLLSKPTICAAAEMAGIGESTLRRWLDSPAFSAAYKAARGQLLESTLTALQSASGAAVETLREVMTDKTAQPSARVSAARTVLEIGLKAREVLEVEERLAALEERFAAQQPQPQGVKRR